MAKVQKWVWKETAEVIGVVGIIAGIVVLAVELRQNNALMEADSRATVVAMNTQIWSTVIEEEGLAPTVLKDRRGETLTDAEEMRLNALWVRGLYNAEYAFRDAPDLFQQQIVVWQRAYAAYGSLRRTWSGDSSGSALDGKDMFDPDFVEFMESNVFAP